MSKFIRSQIIAAKRSGVNNVILPEDNGRDFEELPEFIKSGVTVFYASTYQDVYEIALRGKGLDIDAATASFPSHMDAEAVDKHDEPEVKDPKIEEVGERDGEKISEGVQPSQA
jgi:hypothetical protein